MTIQANHRRDCHLATDCPNQIQSRLTNTSYNRWLALLLPFNGCGDSSIPTTRSGSLIFPSSSAISKRWASFWNAAKSNSKFSTNFQETTPEHWNSFQIFFGPHFRFFISFNASSYSVNFFCCSFGVSVRFSSFKSLFFFVCFDVSFFFDPHFYQNSPANNNDWSV
eukprot:Lithocolla_globosa_v1_NODE_5740_length_1193_cov_3.795255.p2 type:complete len:166 gc:universal NODE_5740_length_1193_cov_3.795255:598-1095(+)